MKTRIECEEITIKMLNEIRKEMEKFNFDEIKSVILEKSKNDEGITSEEIDLLFEKKKKMDKKISKILNEDYPEALGIEKDFLTKVEIERLKKGKLTKNE